MLWQKKWNCTLYGLVIGVLVYKLFFFELKHLTASIASSILYLEVVSAIVLGYFIFDEKIEWNTILGGMLILISSSFISKFNKKEGNVKTVEVNEGR